VTRLADPNRDWMLQVARGDIDTDTSRLLLEAMHANRDDLGTRDPELAAALDEGDRLHPERNNGTGPPPWQPDIDVDPDTNEAFANLQDARTVTIDQAHATFRRWLGDGYDTDSLDAVLCTLAAECLGGDPLWLLVVSGSGNAKTETVQAATGAGAIVTSTITSEGALLSGSPKKDRSRDATGGLLRVVGNRGVLVIKDVTSILSMNRDLRTSVLAALREVYDGYWSRNLGVDGGRTLTWEGRIAVIGAVTTAWDRAHSVISSMGDRFVLLRTDSTEGRIAAGRQAIGNTGDETKMRGDLSNAISGVLHGMNPRVDLALTDDETERLLAAADLVTLARTGVEFDYQGNVIDAHAPEMPTRFAKQLAQVIRGGVSLGMDRQRAMRLALRCARDSMPPLRLALVDDIAANPGSTVRESRRRIDKPRNTVDRQLQALHMLNVLTCDEEQEDSRWRYRLADGIDPRALLVPEMSPPTHSDTEKSSAGPDKSGTRSDPSLADLLCTECGQLGRSRITGLCPNCANPGQLGPLNREEMF
jgi:hypothetical protein